MRGRRSAIVRGSGRRRLVARGEKRWNVLDGEGRGANRRRKEWEDEEGRGSGAGKRLSWISVGGIGGVQRPRADSKYESRPSGDLESQLDAYRNARCSSTEPQIHRHDRGDPYILLRQARTAYGATGSRKLSLWLLSFQSAWETTYFVVIRICSAAEPGCHSEVVTRTKSAPGSLSTWW